MVGRRTDKTLAESISEADALMRDLLESGKIDTAPALPDEVGHYEPVAAFYTSDVRHSTTQWGDLEMRMRVGRVDKYTALPATDFPGSRLFVVVYGPAEEARGE